MAQSLLMGLGKGMEGFGQTLIGGLMLRAQLEREKLTRQHDLDQLKLKSQLQQGLMREEQGLIRQREESVENLRYQKAIELESMRVDKALEVEDKRYQKALDLEEKKEEFKRETDKKNWENFEKLRKQSKIGSVSPSLAVPYMRKLDEIAGIPEELQGKGLGAMMLQERQPEHFEKSLQYLEAQSGRLFGGVQEKQTDEYGISPEGKPYAKFGTTTEERPLPKSREEIISGLGAWMINQGKDPQGVNTWMRDVLASPEDSLKRQALNVFNDPKTSPNDKFVALWTMGVDTPAMRQALTSAEEGAKAIVAGTAQTPEAAVNEWARFVQNYIQPFQTAIVNARNSGTDENRKYAKDLEAQLKAELQQYANLFNKSYSKFGLSIDPNTLAPISGPPARVQPKAVAPETTNPKVKDFKDFMRGLPK